MKTILHASLLVSLCGLLLLLTPAAHADSKLLAPLYPGAVPDSVATDNYHAYFLSKDPIEKVRAYYEARMGKLADTSDRAASVNDAQALMCPLDAVTICMGKILMPQGRVAAYLKDVTEAYNAGLRLEAKRRAPQVAAPINKEDEAALTKAGLPTRAELQAA
ncbi:MAG: hypothetical protein ACRETQ_06540 [Gammaproteobacteria bacterium]